MEFLLDLMKKLRRLLFQIDLEDPCFTILAATASDVNLSWIRFIRILKSSEFNDFPPFVISLESVFKRYFH